MFTDWTQVEPTYFFARGAIWGFVLCIVLTKVVIPFLIKGREERS